MADEPTPTPAPTPTIAAPVAAGGLMGTITKLLATIKDPQMLIAQAVLWQFFLLIVGFGITKGGAHVLQLDAATQNKVLDYYAIAFTAAWGFYLGSSSGSKDKSDTIKTQLEKKP